MSRHGTMLNGVRLLPGKAAPLAWGDHLRIGPYTLRVLTGDGPPQSDKPLAASSESSATSVRVVDSRGEGEFVESVDTDTVGRLAQHRLDLLLSYAAAINTAPDEPALATALLDAALAGSGYGRGALLRKLGRDAANSAGPLIVAGEHVCDLVLSRFRGGRTQDDAGFTLSASLLIEAAQGKPARLGAFSGANADWGQSIADLRIHSALCLPMFVGDEVTRFLYLDARGAEAGVEHDAAGFCVALARIGGLAMSNLIRAELEHRQRLLEAQLGAAREAQQLIVPPPSGTVAGLQYALRMRPGMYVAGDLFDILQLPDGRVAVFLGDVTGEGVGAGILMAGAQSHLHAALLHTGDPQAAVNEVNAYLSAHSPADRFVSLWVGVFDRDAQKVRFVDAGHGHWLLVPHDGPPHRPSQGPGGPPVAIDADITYEAAEFTFRERDRLVLFSDGIVEQSAPQAEGAAHVDRFGLDRAKEVLSHCTTVDQDTRRLLRAVLDFAQSEALDDDTTVASVAWTTPAAPPPSPDAP